MDDPFLQKILQKLSGPLDTDLFEECVADLIRAEYPGTVAIYGGGDSGMDGAIPRPDNPPAPLICTTGKDAIGNLTRNLKSYKRNRLKARVTVFASNQKLTPKQVQNLYKRSKELGFELWQVFEQRSLSERLLKSPYWCRRLLNLTGEPSVFSKTPKTARPMIGPELIGRDADLQWLCNTSGDRLLIGQPGTGKTFLLKHYVDKRNAFFLVSTRLDAIASELREKQPEVLIIDDAHSNRDLVISVIQLRQDLGAAFSLLLVSWPGESEEIAHLLNIPSANQHKLDLQDRDQIVTVVQKCGMINNVELIREIVNQSEGKVGLAVTLTDLCIKGDFKKVLNGEALEKLILSFPGVGKKASEVLAAFAVGGDQGLTMVSVAEYLALPLLEVRHLTTDLSTAGILEDTGRGYLAVRPPTLRFVLIKNTFFCGAKSLPIIPLLRLTSSAAETILTLLGAKAKGAPIPKVLIIPLLVESAEDEIWEKFAWIGRDEVQDAIQLIPNKVYVVARPGLHYCPEVILPLLLSNAEKDHRESHNSPDHPLRRIEDWIEQTGFKLKNAVSARVRLLDAILEKITNKKDLASAYRALPFVFTLKCESRQTDPGKGRNVNITWGTVPDGIFTTLFQLWSRTIEVLLQQEEIHWVCLIKTVECVAYAGHTNIKHSKPFIEHTKALASKMLQDVAHLSRSHPGILKRCKEISKAFKFDLKVKIDSTFSALFPEYGFEERKTGLRKKLTEISRLADVWSRESPKVVAERICLCEAAATLAEITYPRLTFNLAIELTKRVTDHLIWAKELVKFQAQNDVLGPFVNKAAESNETGWEELVLELLKSENHALVAVEVVLSLALPPECILLQTIQIAPKFSQPIKVMCLRKQIPLNTLKKLLNQSDSKLAQEVAIGTWSANRPDGIPREIHTEWWNIIAKADADEYWLSEILSSDPQLAESWITHKLVAGHLNYHENKLIQSVVKVLSLQSREQLLNLIPNDLGSRSAAKALVGSEPSLFIQLIHRKIDPSIYLECLEFHGGGVWEKLAEAALNAGHSTSEIASYVVSNDYYWIGKLSDHWKTQIEIARQQITQCHSRLQPIWKLVLEQTEDRYNIALNAERIRDIKGE
jgi:hypothetical protein